MLNYYITVAVIGNTGLGTLRTMDTVIKMNDFINAVQDPCGHAEYEQSQFDLLLYNDKRSNACQHHIYNSLHEYHHMRALYPVFRQDNKRTEAYYSVLWHEMGHWSGHKSRLDRDMSNKFGDAKYAMEELIAELTSAYCCA